MLQSFLAVCLNLITVLCILKFKFLRSASNVLVASLAVCDMLRGSFVLVLPVIRDVALPRTNFIPMCFTILGFGSTLIIVQHTSFSFLAYERLVSLKATLGNDKKWRFSKAFLAVGVSWACGLLYCSMGLILRRSPSMDDICTPKNYSHPAVSYVGAGVFVITTFTTTSIYLVIANMYIKRNRQVNGDTVTARQIRRRKGEFKVAKMLGMVVGVFLMLYLPFVICLMLIKPESSAPLNLIYQLSLISFDVNFWINPIIYAWRSTDFRKAFWLVVRTCKRMRKTNNQVTSVFTVAQTGTSAE